MYFIWRERSGSVVQCLTQDRRAAGWSQTGITAFSCRTATLDFFFDLAESKVAVFFVLYLDQ